MHKLVIPPSPYYPGSLGDKSIMLSIANNNMDIAVDNIYDSFWQNLGFDKIIDIKKIDKNLYDEVLFFPTDTIDGAFGTHNIQVCQNISNLFINKNISFNSFSYGSKPIKQSIDYIRSLDAVFSLRDQYSLHRFKTLFPDKTIYFSPDPAFRLPIKKPQNDTPLNLDHTCVGICPANHEYKKYANIIELCLKKKYNPVLIINDLRPFVGDIDLCIALSKQYDCSVIKTNDPREIKYYISQMAFIITGRMHVAIYALSLDIKVYGFDYNEKMRGCFQIKNQQQNVINNIIDIYELQQ